MTTAAPFTYFGGKHRLASWIVSMLPQHDHYVEPYAGSLSVLLAKPRSPMETVSDVDGDLVAFWRVLRSRPQELAAVCALTPHSRTEHAAAHDRPDHLDELERARRVWVQLTQGRSGSTLRTGWRHYVAPTGTTGMPDYLAGYVGRMLPAAERIAGVSLESRPALDLIERYGRERRVCLYVDPPYLGATRSSGGYRHDMASEAEHRELLDALLDCRSAVVLSGYDSPLYREALSGWHVSRATTSTGQGGNRTEVVWCNRLPEPSLFDEPAEETSCP